MTDDFLVSVDNKLYWLEAEKALRQKLLVPAPELCIGQKFSNGKTTITLFSYHTKDRWRIGGLQGDSHQLYGMKNLSYVSLQKYLRDNKFYLVTG